jgi:hypothetical protein
VAANVADDDTQAPVGRLHRVVEVAAQQGAAAPRARAGGDPGGAVGNHRPRGEPPFQPCGFLCLCLREHQLTLGLVGLATADRVADRARQHAAVDLALDEIVLCARLHGGGPGRLVVEPGQHDQRDRRPLHANPGHGIQTRGVRQLQVEQHAVDLRFGSSERLGERAAAGNPRSGQDFRELVLDEQRVAVVVLDEQQREPAIGLAVAGVLHRPVA